MLDTLAVIEEIFKDFVDDNDQAFHQVKGPFYVLDRIQNALIALQNMLFSESTKLDMDIRTLCTVMVTKAFDHDIANRMIDSMRSGLRNATFGNVVEKTQLAEILQTYKTSRDAGDTIDLDNFLSEIVSVCKHDEQEDYPEQPFRDVRKPSGTKSGILRKW